MDIKEFIMSLKIPSFLIKKILPPKKSFYTLDSGLVQIKAVNVVQPFMLPEKMELGDFDINEFDPYEYGKLILDGEEIDISKGSTNLKAILESFKIYFKGESYSIEEILGGKAGGITIAMGDSITVLMKLDDKYFKKLTEGKHVLKIESDKIPKVEINFELTKKNINVEFDPSN